MMVHRSKGWRGPSKVVAVLGGALAVAGCNSAQTLNVKAGTSAIVSQLVVYSKTSCAGLAAGQARITSQPTNGVAVMGRDKAGFTDRSHPCFGQSYDRTYVKYTPRIGFRGQDRISVSYDFDSHDGGGRASIGEDVVINVQ